MSKFSYVIIVFAMGYSATSIAQTDPRGACKADYEKYCAGTAPGGGRVVACLTKQRNALSDGCRKVLDGRAKRPGT